MMNRILAVLKPYILPASVFLTGACILVIEVVAVRALSPYFGNTIFTFSSVISVILAALSIGYYAGGRFADRHPSPKWFFGAILAGGVLVLGFYFVGMMLIPLLSAGLSLTVGPMIASLLVFFIPALLLGTLSPYAVTLQAHRFPDQGIGTVAGQMFFWSTFGSITGSLLAGFVLIPHLGIDRIFASVGVVLCVLGAVPLVMLGSAGRRVVASVVAGLVLAFMITTSASQAGNVVYKRDGIYEKITVHDGFSDGRPTRFFQQDRSTSGAMFLDTNNPTDLVYKYTNYYKLYSLFKPDTRRTLVIGGGAYSVPRALLAQLPADAVVDVSEIEPSLIDIAQQYFDLPDDPRLRNHVEDGRRFLNDTTDPYDMIFSDVYYSLFSIPAHFTTQEFFTLAKSRLSDGGIFVANLIGNLSRQEPSLLFSEMKTFREAFPNSYFFAVDNPAAIGSQNIMFVGVNGDTFLDFDVLSRSQDPFLRSLAGLRIDPDRFELSAYPVMTDDYAPVEYLTGRVLGRAFRTSKVLDGDEMIAVIKQQLRYGPRHMGAVGREAFQKFLTAELRQHADDVMVQSWDYAASDGNTYELSNIVARFHPERTRRIILGTHYDSKRFADLDRAHPNDPVPGANDSASGVAVLLELARVLGTANNTSDIGIDIVLFDGEEGDIMQSSDYHDWQPLGSTYFAQHLNDLYPAKKPESAIILDMVCDKDLKILQEASSVKNAPHLVKAFWKSTRAVDAKVFPEQLGQTIRDDHTPLNRAGIPSMLLIDMDYLPFHTTRDTADKCSPKSLETVAGAVLEYVRSVK